MSTSSRRCSNCGAALSVERGETRARCTYCGVDNDLAPPPPASPPIVIATSGPSTGLVIGVVVVLALALVGVVAGLSLSRGAASAPVSAPVAVAPAAPIPAAPSTSPAPRPDPYAGLPRGPAGFQWVDQYAAPVGVDANGDGVEDLAGPFVIDSQGKLEVWVGVLDGKDFHLLWKSGPFGIREKATRKTGVAVGKGRMVAVEVKGLAHVYDLRSGDELAVFPYSQSDARGLCAVPADEGAVFIGDPGGSGLRIDLATAKSTPVKSPKGCAYRDPPRARDSGDPTQEVAGVLAVPAPEGFDWNRVPLGDGVDGVGVATPKGDEGLVLVGVDAKSHAVRWQQSAAAVFGRAVDRVDLVRVGGGAAYLQLPWELVALDAATGHLRWNDPGATAGGRITLTASRLYAAGLEWSGMPVDVYDVATGKRLARLGHGMND
jgi:outer membrane protein assembly factor BamB